MDRLAWREFSIRNLHLCCHMNLIRTLWTWSAPVALAFATWIPARAQTTFVPQGATWKYLDNGSNQGTAWQGLGFDDSAWASGPAQLGYGDGDEATVIQYGPNASAKYITTYFRRNFTVTDPNSVAGLKLELLRDDGAVVYLNGTEVARSNLPTGTIDYLTLAPVAVGGADETTFFPFTLSPSLLVSGSNIIAVEIHQQSGTSSDVSFDLRLTDGLTGPVITRSPYLQSGTANSIVVCWRTDIASNSRVSVGTTAGSLTVNTDDATLTTEHAVQITGLSPDTQYFYGVGTTTASLVSGAEYNFVTSPATGTTKPTRIWVLGDSGTANATATAVRNGYSTFAAGRRTDVWLMLGDDAYNTGTDAEFQSAVFNMYPGFLRQTVLWSAIGNHETAQLTNPALTIPYFQIFNFPTNGQAGGAASGTEKYYSFDYGSIHFIALDSMTSSRQPGSAMLTWLQADLASTVQDWIIAFWHHPPYTKGSHDSDTETELIEMRQNVLPILEAGGVDLVLSGHSHCYERSYLLNGHYGLSTTLVPTMKLNAGDGRDTGNGAYTKPDGLSANQGSVYIVAGNGGQATTWTGGSTLEFNPTPHPAMYYSALHVGSLVIDVNGNRLDAKMIRDTGAVDDSFSIVKNLPNQPPTISISAAGGPTFTAPANISINATTGDADGTVQQVDFYANAVPIGSVNASPFNFAWNNVPAGSYTLTAIATDNLGASTAAQSIGVTVNPPIPAAPTGLVATAGTAQVSLAWTASAGAASYTVKRATVSGGPYTTIASGLVTPSYLNNSGLVNGTPYYYVVSAVNLGGESGNSTETSATPLPPIPAAPTGLVATAGTAQVSLAWTASAGAASYTVRRATVSGGPYTTIASGLVTPSYLNNSGLVNGTPYYYVVSAVNLGGESGNSAQASATPLPPIPAAPTGLVATAGTAQVSLAWTASAGAASYTVKRATVSGGPYTTIASGLVTPSYLNNSGLVNGTPYYYVVSAVNLGGESGNSTQASATPLPPVPAAPTGLAATAGNAQVSLSWSATAGATSYTIKRGTVSGGPYTTIASGITTTSYVNNSGLINGTAYYYVVAAVNLGGTGPNSAQVAATPLAPPLPPSGLSATAVSATQINLHWTDGSSTESGFLVERSSNGTSFTQIGVTAANATGYSDTGLTANKTYYYRVRATNVGGNSAYTSTASAKTPRR